MLHFDVQEEDTPPLLLIVKRKYCERKYCEKKLSLASNLGGTKLPWGIKLRRLHFDGGVAGFADRSSR
jgi:hypothetical protein